MKSKYLYLISKLTVPIPEVATFSVNYLTKVCDTLGEKCTELKQTGQWACARGRHPLNSTQKKSKHYQYL